MSGFERLLSPTELGTLRLRNRIALSPMGTNLGEEDGTVGDAQAAWYEARARGGAGLVIVGSVGVAHPIACTDARQLGASDDAHLAGLQRLADVAHRHGSAIAAQLVHNGTQSLLDIAAGRPMLVPSKKRPPGPDELSGMVTPEESADLMAPLSEPTAAFRVQVATDDDLAWVVERFVDAARRVLDAGFDGIELHAGHGYLLHSFLSPSSNQRDDRWGGSPARRAELLVEVTRAVRTTIGSAVPLWARIGAFEAHRSPGQTLDDALIAMGLAVDAGLDAVHVTAYGEPMVATGITDGHTPHEPGALVPAAARVRRELGVPVIAMGRLTPEAAEQALAEEAADIIAMGRALIADPDLPAKLAAGARNRIRPCAYQYRCIGAIFRNRPVECSVNPEAGREAVAASGPTEVRHVVVAGGGPAGLECARRLAERGHRVELWEASDRLGGALALAERIDPDLDGLLSWLVGGAEDAGVDIHLGRPLTEVVEADVVVWAAGADWGPGLAEVERWFDGGQEPTALAVHGSSEAAVSVALRARRARAAVTLVPDDPVLARELGRPGRFRLVADALTAGVAIADTAPPGASTVHLGSRTARPAPDLGRGIEVHVIGDASGAQGLAAAFRSAADVAARI